MAGVYVEKVFDREMRQIWEIENIIQNNIYKPEIFTVLSTPGSLEKSRLLLSFG